MIITKEFIWMHLGKTGGDMFHYLMNKYYGGDIIFQHDTEDPDKHLNVVPEEYNHIKKYIIGFRRLPSWIISHNRHKVNECENVCYEDVVQYTKNNRIVFSDYFSSPDTLLKKYIQSNMIDRTSFIRQEYLLEDFVKIVGRYLGENSNITQEEKNTIKNENNKVKEILLTEKDEQFLYQSNPLWKNIENAIY